MDKTILEKELKSIVDISKKFEVKKVILFGSCLEDIESARDIDIAVSGVRPESFFEMYGQILDEIDDELDLLPLEYIREHLSTRILSQGVVLYEKRV